MESNYCIRILERLLMFDPIFLSLKCIRFNIFLALLMILWSIPDNQNPLFQKPRIRLTGVNFWLNSLRQLINTKSILLFGPKFILLTLGDAAPAADHLRPQSFQSGLFHYAFLLTAILFKLFLYLCLQILHADLFRAWSLLTCFQGFGVEILMDGVNLIVILLDLEMLVRERIDPSANDAHLVFI